MLNGMLQKQNVMVEKLSERSHLKSESCLDLALILRTWRMNTFLQVDIIKLDL